MSVQRQSIVELVKKSSTVDKSTDQSVVKKQADKFAQQVEIIHNESEGNLEDKVEH